jgi:hypothetical protein
MNLRALRQHKSFSYDPFSASIEVSSVPPTVTGHSTTYGSANEPLPTT